jgi:hypothetical protein
MFELLLDRAGRRRSPATMPGFHFGRPPRNEGVRYPAEPPMWRRSSRCCERPPSIMASFDAGSSGERASAGLASVSLQA